MITKGRTVPLQSFYPLKSDLDLGLPNNSEKILTKKKPKGEGEGEGEGNVAIRTKSIFIYIMLKNRFNYVLVASDFFIMIPLLFTN
jgi:hypothetical protein